MDSGQGTVIKQGLTAKTTLEVSCRATHFMVFVNGAHVGQDGDSSLPAMGRIGVTTGPGGTAVFNNFAYFA